MWSKRITDYLPQKFSEMVKLERVEQLKCDLVQETL